MVLETEDKYITSDTLWILNLPKPLIRPVSNIIWYFFKIKNTFEYISYMWSNNVVFDLDSNELLLLLEYKLKRTNKQLAKSGNPQGSKEIEQTLLYLDQYNRAEEYVTLPKELIDKDINSLIKLDLDENGQVNVSFDMPDDVAERYKEYLDELVYYETESWSLFWDSLKQKAIYWV